MKAASTPAFSSKLINVEAAKPDIGPEDVLVEVHASSVNPKDWKLNTSISSLIPKIGPLSRLHIIGDDLAGVIVEKGSNVDGFEVGDQVYGMDMRLRTSACAEYARIAAKRVAHMPKKLGFREAAAVPLAAQTALQAFQIADLKAGQQLLIIGASGGVGSFAVQIAKAMSAHVTGVCSSRNTERVKNLGADAVIDYTKEDFKKTKNEFDVIFDATAYETLGSCSGILKKDGIFITTSGHGRAVFDAYRPRMSSQRIRSVWVESWTRDLETLAELIDSGKVKPVIDSIFPLEDIQSAYEKSKTGRAQGKIVIEVKPDQA